jgi:head-tail adaptor
MIPVNTDITLQSSLACTSVYGTVEKIWSATTYPKIHARLLTEDEVIRYSKQGFEARIKIYTNDATLSIKEGDRFIYKGDVYFIGSVDNPHNLNHHLEIIAGQKDG